MSSSSDTQQKKQQRLRKKQQSAAAPVNDASQCKQEKKRKKKKTRNLQKKQQQAYPEEKVQSRFKFIQIAPQDQYNDSVFQSKQIATQNRMASFIQAQFRMKMHMKKYKTQKKRQSPPQNQKKQG